MLVCSHRELQQVLPIPDIHQVSDCDTIYRFLIARKLSVDLALQDILHYIAFREKYRLNHIVWDEELDRMYNGGDGDELVEEVVGLMQDADTKAKKKGKAFKDSDIKVSRPLLQPGWSQWNCGVDVDGNLVLLQRPQPKQLSHLETKWPYVEGGYDGRRSDFDSGTAPCSNLLARLYLRAMEKGRRISALLNYNNREILRGLGGTVNTESVDRGVSNDRAVTCILDVGAVSLGHLTSSKYREAMHLFQTVSLLGQHYYPENMKRLIIVNGGFIFNVAFKIVKVWLDPDTQKKIVLLSETNKATIADVVSPTEPIMSPASDVSGCSGSTAFSPENPANYKLREALSSYIHPRWIPSFYGGANASTASPYSFPCGEEGTASSPLVSSPFYRRAGDLVAGATLPDMLPDDFVRHHSEVGTAVTPSEFAAYKTYLLNRA